MPPSYPTVFIHSGWRCSSTYVWHRFRALPGVRAYYEPWHEQLARVTAETIALETPGNSTKAVSTALCQMCLRGDQASLECIDGAALVFQPQGDATQVTWAMHGPAPYISKLMGLVFDMDTLIGKDFEAGLANLKTAGMPELLRSLIEDAS